LKRGKLVAQTEEVKLGEPEQVVTNERRKLDLSLFKRYKVQDMRGRRGGSWLSVAPVGLLRFSAEASKYLEEGQRVGLYLNKAGTILVVKEEEDGFPVLPPAKKNGKDKSKRVHCKPLADDLQAAGIELPARFEVKWDEENKWLECRLIRPEKEKEHPLKKWRIKV